MRLNTAQSARAELAELLLNGRRKRNRSNSASSEQRSNTHGQVRICNDYRLLTDAATIFEDFSLLKIKIRFPEGKPNIEAREDIKITDAAPIVRTPIVRTIQGDPQAGDLVQRRWSWPGQNGSPSTISARTDADSPQSAVSSQRSAFTSCTEPVDQKKKKDKRLFTKSGEPLVLYRRRLASGQTRSVRRVARRQRAVSFLDCVGTRLAGGLA
jgi:hypothetical protein